MTSVGGPGSPPKGAERARSREESPAGDPRPDGPAPSRPGRSLRPASETLAAPFLRSATTSSPDRPQASADYRQTPAAQSVPPRVATGKTRVPGPQPSERRVRTGRQDLRPRTKLWPGEPGTKKLLRRFGSRLVCVRYLYDARRARRVTTVELIVDDGPCNPRSEPRPKPSARPRKPDLPDPDVGIAARWEELHERKTIAAAGGVWDPRLRLWRLPRSRAMKLALPDLPKRLVELPGADSDRTPTNVSPRR